jgi:hypothetical protein
MSHGLIRRFPQIARMLLACHQESIGEANAYWLSCRLEHHDWMEQDEVRLREMLPISARWLLLDPYVLCLPEAEAA